MDEKKLKKLKDLLTMVNESISVEDFEKSFRSLIDLVTKIESKLIQKIDAKTRVANNTLSDLQDLHRQTIKRIDKENESNFSSVKKWAVQQVGNVLIKTQFNERIKELDNKIKEADKKLSEVRDGKDADTEIIVGEVLTRIPSQEPHPNAESHRDQLETLKDDDRLDVSAIKGIMKLLAKLEKKIDSKVIYTGGSGAGGGGHVKLTDISSSLNGVTKTFSLPAFWRIISVQSSSFPNAFRPTTDYTTDADLMQITFTSEINAATTLATGQTITIIYAEA